MSRMKDIATEALIEERGKDWGDPVITHTQIAKVWSGLLHRKLIADIEPHEVASMMSGLKLVRHGINPHNPDSLDDSDAYNEINRRCIQAQSPEELLLQAIEAFEMPEEDDFPCCSQVEEWFEMPEEDDFPCCSQGEEWFEVPLPGFGQGSASPGFGALIRGTLVDRDEGPDE